MAFGYPYLLEYLKPKFRLKLFFVMEQLKEKNINYEIFATLRDPQQQAILWMKSRSEQEIRGAFDKLTKQGAPWLSDLVKSTHRPYGRWETNNLPGLSWHQWGEAVSIRVLSESGRVIWNPNNKGYRVLADLTQMVNLTSGFFWKRRDVVHVQLRADAVRAYYNWFEIDQLMKEKFDGVISGNSAIDFGSSSAGPGGSSEKECIGSSAK